MAYTYPGMRKLNYGEVIKRHKEGSLVGCFLLYDDNTESTIPKNYEWKDVAAHILSGGMVGEEREVTYVTELCPSCEEEVVIKTVGVQKCPNCWNVILPCSVCDDCIKDCGYMKDEKYVKSVKENSKEE